MVSIEVQVNESVKDFTDKLGNFIKVCDSVLADGFQAGSDLPPVALSAYNDLLPAMQRLKDLGPALKDEQFASYRGLVLGLLGIVETLVKK